MCLPTGTCPKSLLEGNVTMRQEIREHDTGKGVLAIYETGVRVNSDCGRRGDGQRTLITGTL